MIEENIQSGQNVRARKDIKPKIILGAIILATIAMIVLLIVLARQEHYDDDYFVSDDSKLVVAMDKSIAAFEDSEYEPDITYILYYYSGDNITGMKVFYAYDSEDEAREADANVILKGKEWATSKNLSGKYLVFGVSDDQYEGLTITDIRKVISDMKSAGTMYEPDKDTQDEVIENDD